MATVTSLRTYPRVLALVRYADSTYSPYSSTVDRSYQINYKQWLPPNCQSVYTYVIQATKAFEGSFRDKCEHEVVSKSNNS